ncbi:hypothetical protein K5549_021338, partial [Capra hircus]
LLPLPTSPMSSPPPLPSQPSPPVTKPPLYPPLPLCPASPTSPTPTSSLSALPTSPMSSPPPQSSQPRPLPPVTTPLATPLALPQYPLLPPRPPPSVASPEGLAHVHVPFSLQDLAHIEQWLGSYSANPSNYIKNFTQQSWSYALTWQDVFVILGSTTIPEERKAIWAAARVVADQKHLANPADSAWPPGAAAVPEVDPDWDYQEGQRGRANMRYMVECLVEWMETTSLKVVNLLKLDELTQGPDKNLAAFLNRQTEALTTYTRIAPDSPAGVTTLANHFISQSASDIRKKLSKAEDGTLTPLRDLVKMAFKVYNAQEEAAEASRKARLKQKAKLQANPLDRHTQALVAALRPATGQKGPWACQCPNPRPPTKPCPCCKQPGHWASDCPWATQDTLHPSQVLMVGIDG